MNRCIVAGMFLFLTCGVCPADVTLVTTGAVWKYLDNGSNQSTSWRSNAFNDISWLSGSAQLGYGDGDESTTNSYGTVSSNRYITTYYRHAFLLSDPSIILNLKINLLRDDGAVVYLNGVEVRRDNMPSGNVLFTTRATTALGAPEESTFYETLIPSTGLLLGGTNVIAVEIHQAGPSSSDISFDFSLDGITNPPPPSIIRGPYLQVGTPTSVVIRWRTDIATNTVAWISNSGSTSLFSLATAVTEHEIRVTGLAPSTTYMYAIGYGTNKIAGGDTNHVFSTSPVPGSRGPVRIWVLGDSGTKNQNARDVRDAFYSWSTNRQPDLWLMLGDNAYNDGTDLEFQAAVFDMYPATLRRSVLWTTLGNHDGHSADSATESGPYYNIFTLPRNGEAGGMASGTEAYYSFDYANIHFICLESYETDRSTNGAMFSWLSSDIASSTQEWMIAFWHHPPYTKGSHDSDTEIELKEMRTNYLPKLEAAGVDLVLCGHSHSYERTYLLNHHYGASTTFNGGMKVNGGSGREDGDGVYDKTLTNGSVYAVPGSSGQISGGALNHPAMYVSLNELGSMVLDIEGAELNAYFIGNTPVVKDYFTIRKDTPTVTLETFALGPGKVEPAGGTYLSNTMLNISAIASNFHIFTDWSGDLAGNVNPSSIVLNGDKQVTAQFNPVLVTNQVPQWWLFANGLGTNDADALDDQDEDGMITWEEYIANTLPSAATSYFVISSFSVTNEPVIAATVQFMTSTGRIYGIDRVTRQGNETLWTPIINELNGTGTLLEYQDPDMTNPATYRVRVRLP
jgi:Calcineurin-like phosphoesterase